MWTLDQYGPEKTVFTRHLVRARARVPSKRRDNSLLACERNRPRCGAWHLSAACTVYSSISPCATTGRVVSPCRAPKLAPKRRHRLTSCHTKGWVVGPKPRKWRHGQSLVASPMLPRPRRRVSPFLGRTACGWGLAVACSDRGRSACVRSQLTGQSPAHAGEPEPLIDARNEQLTTVELELSCRAVVKRTIPSACSPCCLFT